MDKRLKWLSNLVCFEAAARHQSYSKAAQELFISQAAVSQKMRQLEENLGVSLFYRQGRKMLLTSPGRTLLESCQTGFSAIINGLNQVQEEPVDGSLTISSTQAFCSLWLLPKLIEFYAQHPNINVNLQASNRLENLHEGHIDIAIRFSRSTSSLFDEGLVVERFGENGVIPVCSPQYQKDMKLRKPEDFLHARLLELTFNNWVNWESYFEHCGVKFDLKSLTKTSISSSDLSLSAALAGQGVMLASDIMIGQYLESGQLVVPVGIFYPARWKSHFVYLKDTPKFKRINYFREWLTEEMRRHEEQQLRAFEYL